MNALVTGGGGFLGGAIVRQLLARGDTVRSLSRNTYDDLEALGVAQHTADIADAASVSGAVKGNDVVFHVVGVPGAWGPYEKYHRTNVLGTQAVIDACREHGVAHLVYTSTPSVAFQGYDQEALDELAPYPDRYDAHYPATKAEAERRVLAAHGDALATVAIRPHLVWGPRDASLLPRMLARARAGRLRRFSGTQARIDPTYVEDAARAHLLAADKLAEGAPVGGRAYFVSGGEPVGVWEMVDRLLGAAGEPPVRRAVSPRFAYAVGWLLEALYTVLRVADEPPLTRWVVRQMSITHCLDISAARRDLGYEPRVSIDEGIERLRDWLETETAPPGPRE